MATVGEASARWGAALLVALALVASACTGSATVTQTGSSGDGASDVAEPTAPQADPTPELPVNPEPTSAPAETTATPSPVETPTPSPDLEPSFVLPLEAFRTDALLGLSSDGTYGYAGTTSPWGEAISCDAVPIESLAVAEVVAGADGTITVLGAGLEQAGDVRQVVFGATGSAAILSSCERANQDTALWLQRGEFGPDGRITSLGNRLELDTSSESDLFLVGWSGADTVEVRSFRNENPDDIDSWVMVRSQISLTTGHVVSAEQFDDFESDGFGPRLVFTTPEGRTYRVIDDPAGRFGCEGYGVARTLEVDTGTERRLALTQPELVFSDVRDLQVSATGYVSWTSGCEGFVSAYVGVLLDDGTIADAHLIDTFRPPTESLGDFQHYRLTADGFLNAIGQSLGPDAQGFEPQFLHYDLSSDPHFINTADPAPQIDQEPLFTAIEGDGTWHVGDTLAADSACGARTLYGQTPGGFVRAFPSGFELDAIVDVDLAEIRRISYPEGDFVSRTFVVQTECPGSYEGRRVWFGTEANQLIWGLGLEQADLGEVADVLGVRDVLQEGSDFPESSMVRVELLDGSVVEVELVAVPRQN